MKRKWTLAALVAVFIGLSLNAAAQPDFTFNVSLDPKQVTESGGQDTWLSPWQPVNHTLKMGGKIRVDIVFPAGHRLDTDDGFFDGMEAIVLNVRGSYPAGTTPPSWPDNQLQIDYWLTGVNPADPGPKVPTASHPWTSHQTPYPLTVSSITGDITYRHDRNMGSVDFSFTDVHAEITATSLASDYIIQDIQIGFSRDNIYTIVPEPATGLLLALAAVLLRSHKRRS